MPSTSRAIRRTLQTSTVRLALAGTVASPLLGAFAPSVRAQVVGSTITGTVLDPTGAVVPNAKVTVHNTDTGTQRSLATDGSGRFSAPSIPVGTYTVSVHAENFAPLERKDITSPSASRSTFP